MALGASHHDVCVATITLARDAAEEQLIRRGLNALSAAALPIVIADGGSGDAFLSFARSLPQTTIVNPTERGLVPQVNASLGGTLRLLPRFILYAESDKQMFFEQKLARFLLEAPLGDDVGVVLAARSEASFQTFPPTQRVAETAINTLTGDTVGEPGDYSYGPFLLHRSLVPHMSRVKPEIGWGWRHYLFALAARIGLRVVHIVDELPCPEDQREEDDDERVHRLKQLAQNVNGLLLGMTAPLDE
jgi:hypothetical protein